MNTENITSEHTSRPFGFWLRTVDGLLARRFEAAFEAEGITRRDGRILTLLAGDAVDPERAARLQRGGGKKLGALRERGWVAETDGAWTLTDEGRAAQARLADAVSGIRSTVSGSVSEEDFATTLATLESIARELGWDPSERMPQGFGHRGRFGGRGFGHGRGRGFGGGRIGFGGFDPRHSVSPHGERAYERGFDAGFSRGAHAHAG